MKKEGDVVVGVGARDAGGRDAPCAKDAAGPVACERCGAAFGSRNALFRHLKDAARPCGKAVAAEGGLGDSPSQRARRSLKITTALEGVSAGKAAAAQKRWRFTHDLWLGDIPPDFASVRKLRQVIWSCSAPGDPQPLVRKLVRRGYRPPSPLPDGSRPYLAYAFLSFRGAEEAEAALEKLHGREVPGSEGAPVFVMKVRHAVPEGSDDAADGGAAPPQHAFGAAPGVDPPLAVQLAPLSRGEIQGRLARGGRGDGTAKLSDNALLEACCAMYEQCPRPERRLAGAPVPRRLLEPLRGELETLRWPLHSHRNKVTSEQYVILKRGGTQQDEFCELRRLVEAVMAWADPGFPWDTIAVTKNFVGSPHTDWRDQSHQYALACGSYDGGELVVDGGDEVWVVDTRDAVARVDGRHVHWVRGYDGGDRYSLIFFVCREQHATPVGPAVDPAWAPAGSDA